MNTDQAGLLPGEQIETLGDGLFVIQRKDGYRFTSDALLLAAFAAVRRGARVAELGSGSGVISLLVAKNCTPARVDAVEIQPSLAENCVRSVRLSALENTIFMHNMRLQDAPAALGIGVFDAVVCNPPYRKAGSGQTQASHENAVCRHEIEATLEEICTAAARLLRFGGELFLIHQAQRLAEVIYTMHGCGIEPKILCAVRPKPDAAPNLFLIKGVRGGAPGMRISELVRG